MKKSAQEQTLALLARYRTERNSYNTSSREVSQLLVDEISNGTFTVDNAKAAISGLEKQREREDAKMRNSSSN